MAIPIRCETYVRRRVYHAIACMHFVDAISTGLAKETSFIHNRCLFEIGCPYCERRGRIRRRCARGVASGYALAGILTTWRFAH
jgi:hypothetical protein